MSLSTLDFPPHAAVFGTVGGFRASERLDPRLLHVAKTPQVVRGRLPVKMERGARQTDAAQRLAAQLRQPGKHMLDASAGLGNAPVALLLCIRQRPILAASTLDEHAPARIRQPPFTLAIDVALVGQYGPAGVGRVQYVLEVIGVVLARRADLAFADQLVTLVRIGRQLVAEVGVAVLLGPARLNVFWRRFGGDQLAGMALYSTIDFSSLFSDCLGTWTMLASMI